MIKGLLYKIFEEKWGKFNNIWLYSDPHFNDPDSKHFRGESYPGDEEQLKRINSKVGKNDAIIFLGDICDIEFIRKVRGYKILLLGNHDKGASNYKRLQYKMKLDEVHTVQWYDDNKNNIFKIKNEYFFDNRLFDEVYEGPLMLNDRLIISHEDIYPLPSYMMNFHGHRHDKPHDVDSQHKNFCAEAIDYCPVSLLKLLKEGALKDIESIHRHAVDRAVERKSHKRV